MKKLYSLFTALLLLTVWSSNLEAQCSYNNAFYANLSAPAVVGASIGNGECIYAGEYYRVSGLQAGSTYRISTCNTVDVADTRITVFAQGGAGGAQAFNDDYCGLLSRLDFTPTTTGTYDILVDATGPGNTCVSINQCTELTITLVGTSGSTAYCVPTYTIGTANGDFINGVSLGSINNQNTGSVSGTSYNDFTNLSTSLTASSSYTLAIKNNPDFTEIVSAWIDYNQDFEFSEDERLGQVTIGANATGNINFTTDATPLAGNTRMRVRMVFSVPVSGGSVDPCSSTQFGETEDYTVTFPSDPPGPPSGLTFSTNCGLTTTIQDNACPNNSFATVDVSGLTSLGTGHILSSASIIIEHSMAADLDLYLESPEGQIVELSTDNGGSGADYGVYTIGNCTQTARFTMSGSASPISGSSAPFVGDYIPEGDLNDFNAGTNPNGIWRLRACDDFSGDIGTIRYFGVTFEVNATEPPACADAYAIIDGSSNVELNQVLSWTAGSGGATSYDVYFGTAANALVLVSNDQSALSFDPGALNPNTTYYYQIVPANNAGSASGCPVNSFTTVDAGALTILQSEGTVTTCAANYFDAGGVNGNYNNNELSILTILPETAGSAVEVNFSSFQLDESFDFLAIADGSDINAPVIGVFTGTNSPGTITATNPSGALTFYFSSDDAGNLDGWAASVNCVPLVQIPECALNTLPTDASTNASTTSQLSWDAVSGATGYDIYFGTNQTPALVASNVSATTFDPGALLNSTVYYYSIVPVNGNGSALGCATNSFTTEAVPANVILMQNGSVTSCDASFYDSGNSNGNYSNDETLSLTISPATANSVVKVVFNSFATETDLDQLNVYNGSDANGTLLQTLTGSLTGPIEFTSTAVGGALTFVFNSDFQVSDAGWDASISCVQLPDAPSCAVIASPSDASTDVAIDASISWTAGTGGTPDSYDVYFGTASNSLVLVSDNQVGTSYSPSGLLNNTTYFWSVISTNTGGVSADCPVYSFTTEVAIPQVPSCVVVSSPLDNATDVALSSSLSWTAGLTGGTPDSYDVYFGNDANSLTLVSAGQTETTYSPVGLLNNTTYYWSVTATNAGGSSSQCAVSSFTTIAITPEAPSCAVIASPADAATDVALDASISWTAGTGGTPDSYDVYFGTAADALVLVSNDQTSTSYSLSGLANSTTYYWSVTSTNTGGSSSECNVYSFTTTSIVPQAPSCVVVASPSDASIDVATNASISWTPGSGGTPDSYDVYFGTDANALVLVSEGQTSTTYSPSSLLLNTTYYWSIVATNVGGSSADCGVYSFTTITETPVAPECVAVGSPADASTDIALSTTLTWTAGNGGAPDSYDVYFGTAANALVLVSEGQTSTSYSPVGLLNNTTYFWSVTATNSAGSSTNCSVQSFTTIAVANPDTVIMQNGAVTTCNGFFYDSGSISADYQVDEDYTLTISPSTPGSLLQVDFSAFNIEADYDFLSIYNGNSTAAPLINTYTGTNGPGIVVSSATDGSLTFNFTSDVSVTELGWEAAITCIDPNAAPSCATSFAPANASTDNSIATTLSWSNGGGLVTGYNVYFGTAADALVLVSSDQAGTTYNPGALELNTTYFWQVVPVNGSNAAVGCSVQSFTTEAIANIVMQNNSLTVCNANFFDSGDLASNYQSDENYTLTLTPATAGNVLEVIFSSFNTEDTYDSLYVYNGNSTAAPLIGAFTGLVSPGSILSTAADGSLTFVFTSDISVTRAGWSASVTCIDPEALANCATNLQPANAATEVSATGTSISWTSGGGGVTGYDVYFGTDASSLALVSPNQVETSFNLDGLDLNTTYYWQIVPINANGSTSDCAVNSFTTSSIIDVVMSTATITTCSANFYDSGAIGNNYASDENSTITFLPSTPNNAIQVTFNAFDLEQSTFSGTIYDSLIVYNGPDATFPVIGVYSGTTIPGPFVSSDPSGALTFHFSSDVSVTRAGWDADVVCISTLDVPSCVTSVSPSDQSVDALITSQLSWTAPTGVVTGYDVYFGTAIDALVLVSDNQTGTTYDPGTLDVNTTYFWQVVPVNDAGVAVDCNVNSFTTSPSADIVIFNGEITICDANLFDTGGSTGDYQLNEEYTLTIYPSTPGALVQLDFTSFDVEDGWDFLDIYDGNSATGTPAVSLTGNVLPAQFISTATDGSVTLQFTSDGSTNAPGFEIAISCFVAQTAPECVTNPSPVDAEPAAPLNASISWTAANGFPTGYDVYFGTAADALVLVSSGQVGTSYTPAGLTAGTTYYWQVIPVNDIGSATGCQVYSFTTGQEENINMFSGTVTTCLANFYDSQGATANYLLNENNTLVVNPATPNNVMRVTFNSFASETTWDQLLIYSGQTTAGPLLATLTGAALTMPVTYTSTDLTGALTFVFTSDVSITNAGWDADLVCVSTTEIPGCVVNPSPADASTEISATSTNLSWGIGTGIAFTYDVYFGTDPSSLALVSQGQAGTSFNPGQLDLNTTYYWQVVPANASGAAEGCAVYSFTTSSSIDIIMSNATITTCNAHFYDSGNITGNYVNNENYTLTILPDQAGNSIQINFTAFNIENNWDFLRIYNGNSVAAPLIATFTGNTPAQQIPTAPITSSAVDGSLTIVFTSDGSINRPGWSADVTCIDATTVPECAVMVSGPIDGATDVCLNDAVFNWTTGAGAPATSYDVYVDFGGGLTLVSDDQTTTSFDLGVLEANTSYVVQIIPSNANGEAVGCPTITFTTGTCLNYCDASATNCDEYIANVEMANINNPTDCTAGGYNDYTSISADVYVGTATPLTITNGVLDYTQDQCGVWIDWNHDGDFADANETIAITGTPGTGPYTAQVIPPVDAYIGTTTMRVRITFTGAVNPCGNATWGEVEDYSINVFAPLACPFPNNITSSEATTTTSVITWDAVTDALEYQVRYRLVSEPTTVATWATPLIVPSPLSFTFLENLVACEDYVLQIGSVCEAGVEPVFSSNLNFGTRCIECTADLTPEGEDCGLDLNGGCNSGVFGTIACGETICGTSFYDGTNRDTDWFQFDVTSDGVYTVNVLAEFDGTIFFADATDCNNVITPSQGNFVAGEAFTLATSLTVGTYSIILVPSFDQVPFTCTDFNAYTLGLSSGVTQIAPVADVCETTASFNLFAIPAGGVWSGTGITDATAGTFDPSVTGVGSFDVVYQAVGTGCASSDTVTINVGAAPVVDFVGLAANYCSTVDEVVLTGIPAGGIFAITPSVPGAIAGNVFYPNAVSAGSYDITYTVSLGSNSCAGSITQTVTVTDGPVVSIDGLASAVCSQDAPIALAGTPSTGTFSGNGVVGSSFDPTLSGVGPQTITYTVTEAGNVCPGIATAVIQVNPAPVVAISGVSGDYCLNSSVVTMIGTPALGTFSIDGNPSGSTFDPATAGIGTHTLRYEFNNGTCIGFDEVTVNVVDNLNVAITNLPAAICSKDNAILLTSTPEGAVFSGPGVIGGNTFDPSQVTVGLHTITATYTNGNCSAVATQQIVVNPEPVASFNYSANGATVVFNNSSINASSYSWNFGDNSAVSTAVNPTHTYSTNGAYTIELTATSADCGSSTYSVQLELSVGIGSIDGVDMIQLYPNPTSGNVMLAFNSLNQQSFEVRITDATGRLIETDALTNYMGKFNKMYDLSDKAKGVYLFTVSSEKGSINFRVVRD